jgi:hypothetical protein
MRKFSDGLAPLFVLKNHKPNMPWKKSVLHCAFRLALSSSAHEFQIFIAAVKLFF